MKALVVYESMFGNTEKVARAISAGLAEAMEVEVIPVADAPAVLPPEVSLLMIGGPTHAFSMSRPSTRKSAVEQGANAATGNGLREWLASLPSRADAVPVYTFDTRVHGGRHLPGSAAKSAARSARHHGLAAERGESFYVDGTSGPLLDSELDRATAWGRALADPVTARG